MNVMTFCVSVSLKTANQHISPSDKYGRHSCICCENAGCVNVNSSLS